MKKTIEHTVKEGIKSKNFCEWVMLLQRPFHPKMAHEVTWPINKKCCFLGSLSFTVSKWYFTKFIFYPKFKMYTTWRVLDAWKSTSLDVEQINLHVSFRVLAKGLNFLLARPASYTYDIVIVSVQFGSTDLAKEMEDKM